MPRGLLSIWVVATLLAGCASGQSGRSAAHSRTLNVVAAENVWGSVAAQLAGTKATVASIITSPATDPHDYEPTAADARTVAGAQLVIVNGIGYDSWAPKLAAASPVSGRIVIDVGKLVGIKAGGNPHRWYSPHDVQRVVHAIVHDYTKLDPGGAAYFAQRARTFETRGLARYKRLIASIRRRYHGVAVGASESVFAPLAQALGLKLLTPDSFLKAISEGSEPTAADKATIDDQIARREIEVWVDNTQNSTPDVKRLTDAARKQGIPITAVTETLAPASATFQLWQSRQLQALAVALARATGR